MELKTVDLYEYFNIPRKGATAGLDWVFSPVLCLGRDLRRGRIDETFGEHKLFTHFAYYKVSFQIGDDRYTGRLNVGIRKDGSSTLYDLNPFNKQ